MIAVPDLTQLLRYEATFMSMSGWPIVFQRKELHIQRYQQSSGNVKCQPVWLLVTFDLSLKSWDILGEWPHTLFK